MLHLGIWSLIQWSVFCAWCWFLWVAVLDYRDLLYVVIVIRYYDHLKSAITLWVCVQCGIRIICFAYTF